MIDVKDIKKIYQIFLHDGIEKIELQNGDDKISFSIGNQRQVVREVVSMPVTEIPVNSSGQVAEGSVLKSNIYELRSKWIGFFTRLNPKTGESYIKLRDVVKANDIVGHVRVLGVLQDVRAEQDGKLKEVLIEEGQPIEYGQPVMRFEVL